MGGEIGAIGARRRQWVYKCCAIVCIFWFPIYIRKDYGKLLLLKSDSSNIHTVLSWGSGSICYNINNGLCTIYYRTFWWGYVRAFFFGRYEIDDRRWSIWVTFNVFYNRYIEREHLLSSATTSMMSCPGDDKGNIIRLWHLVTFATYAWNIPFRQNGTVWGYETCLYNGSDITIRWIVMNWYKFDGNVTKRHENVKR